MMWFTSTLYKQAENLQVIYVHVVKCVYKVLYVGIMVWCSHMWLQEALCMVLVQK
jgi:hypothetical protein